MEELERQYAGEFHNKLAEEKNLARAAQKAVQNPTAAAGQALKAAKKMQPRELASQVRFFDDIPFFAAIGMAIFKDLIDWVGIGSIPGLGTIITFFVTLGLLMAISLAGSNNSSRIFRKMLLGLGGGLVEMFGFGVNFLPIETATAIGVYVMELHDRAMQEQTS